MQVLNVQRALVFYQQIKQRETQLYIEGILDRFGSEADKNRFKKARSQYSIYVETVELDIASVIVRELEKLRNDFESGIRDLDKAIDDLDATVDLLNALASVLGILAKIITLPV
ncbi:hypothetical protein [Gloeobacter violaceus]|uniref:Glr1711 protein n=1 Tax=Gloeobacter violaceus (strain ATCC 29082 / PCC 7421) TaxID=251221 RepID=Q7NJX0_GLOVI|nr:hypothetical protein [Gloeobacter violaceus]BAC89652.1 glr1711 [Gloeobacter violaceus PCC 7421]